MGAQPFVPGPAPIWIVRSIEPNERLFLGYSERGVDLLINPEYVPVAVDACGRVPTDRIYQGASGVVHAELSHWDEKVYAEIAGHVVDLFGGRGRVLARRPGSVMGLGKVDFAVAVEFPFANKLDRGVRHYQDMPTGYVFPHCVLERESLPRRGARPARLELTFACFPALASFYRDRGDFPKAPNAVPFELYYPEARAFNREGVPEPYRPFSAPERLPPAGLPPPGPPPGPPLPPPPARQAPEPPGEAKAALDFGAGAAAAAPFLPRQPFLK